MNSFLFNRPRDKIFSGLLAILVVLVPTYPAQCEKNLGFVKNVVNKAFGNSLLKTLPQGYPISQNQRIRTSRDSSLEIHFFDNSKLHIGELSDLRLNHTPNNYKGNSPLPKIHIKKGVMRYNSIKPLNQSLEILTPHVVIDFSGGILNVVANSGGTEVTVDQGVANIKFSSESKVVSSGKTFRVSSTGGGRFKKIDSESMRVSVSKEPRRIELSEGKIQGSKSRSKKEGTNENLPSSYAKNEKLAIVGRNPENIIYMDLSYGRVIIEMMPAFAPNHVKRIRQLVRSRFYDGLKFHNVVDGFVAETGDPTGTGLGGSGTNLNAELSEIPFNRGIVGMKHDRNNVNTADSQFFILLGDAKHLEGKYTAWGRVIHGMLLMDRMRKGSPPENPDHIIKMSLAADLHK